MNPSHNLFIIGPTGAGKTSIGRRLAIHYGMPFVDLDQEIERHCGVDVNTIFDVEGEAGFRQRESALLEQHSRRAGVLIATGAGTVLAAHNQRRLSEHGYVVWLQTSVEQQLTRLADDVHRPLLAGVDRLERLQAMALVREPLYAKIADLAVPDKYSDVAEATEHCIALITLQWQRQQAA